MYFSASFVILQGKKVCKETSGMGIFGSHFLNTIETWSYHLLFVHISHPTDFDDLHLWLILT